MRVVLDTNVLISAILWHGRAHELIPLLEEGSITLCSSKDTISELKKVLSRPKFQTKFDRLGLDVPSIMESLSAASKIFELPKNLPVVVEEDPSDDMFLYLAAKSKAKYLVSGDNHLLDLKEFKGIKIVSVDEFLLIVS